MPTTRHRQYMCEHCHASVVTSGSPGPWGTGSWAHEFYGDSARCNGKRIERPIPIIGQEAPPEPDFVEILTEERAELLHELDIANDARSRLLSALADLYDRLDISSTYDWLSQDRINEIEDLIATYHP